MEHEFTPIILEILTEHFGKHARDLFEKSPLLQYLNLKTVSATRGSKARSSFANLYAIYVLVEDYIEHGYHNKGDYSSYDGASFSKLFNRQRQLPFGSKLQNHALNHRLNQEFRKFFHQVDAQPILRVVETRRYWFNARLLIVSSGSIHSDINYCALSSLLLRWLQKGGSYAQARDPRFRYYAYCGSTGNPTIGGIAL